MTTGSETGAVRLDGIVLTDAVSGESFDLGGGPPLAILSVIRHRF